MDWIFFYILTILCVGMVAYGVIRRGHFYHFPFFAAAMFLTFILPQIPGLANSQFIEDTALAKTLFFACLCLAMCGLGWSVGVSKQGARDIPLSEMRLLRAAASLSLIGAYFFYKFGQLPDEERLRGLLTGAAVAYLFFAKLLTYGLAIALVCYARRHSNLALGIILFDSAFYLERILIAGQRGQTAEFCLMIALAFWFQKGWAVPRATVVAGIFASIIGLLAAEEYRQATYYGEERDWSAVMEIDLAKNWERLLEQGGAEMRNAVHAIEQIDHNQAFNFGLSHWNSTVFAYVPAQIVGESFKNSLIIDVPDIFSMDYDPSVGSTPTGITDSFASFWYFGCLKFFVIALLLGWIYIGAWRGNTVMQLIYILTATPSMLAVTHFTNEIVIAWIHMAAFLIPVFIYARIRPSGAPEPKATLEARWQQ